jgi:hypothetical protein
MEECKRRRKVCRTDRSEFMIQGDNFSMIAIACIGSSSGKCRKRSFNPIKASVQEQTQPTNVFVLFG